jgi:hypothetical protein
LFSMDNDFLKNDPVAAVSELKNNVYGSERFADLDAYMEWAAGSVWRFYGKGITINGDTVEARCSSFLNQLYKNNIVQ